MLRSNAGKARISIVWMVTVGVLFLVAIVFAFIAQSDLTAERERVALAQAEEQRMEDELAAEADVRRDVSTVLGFVPEVTADPRSDLEKAKAKLEELKATFPDLGAAEKSFETAIPKIVAAYNARGQQIAELETRIKGLESELAAAQSATAEIGTEKDATIAGLRQQMADEQTNAEARVTELEGLLEQTRTQLSERDGELRKAREDSVAQRRGFESQKAIDDARIAQLSSDTKFARDPFWTQPDGEILEVSDRLGSGWINIGANQRVVRGMVFEVRSGRAGEERVKALAEVTSVKANSAEVAFNDIADRFSPPVRGDKISNRLYDPVGGRNAVLVGRFSGSFNPTDLAALLEKMGIHVQDKVDKTTHFLIVGSELWNDPATGEPLSEPMAASDLPEYKQAESLGVQILPLQDIRDYFRLGAGQ
jgi:hypothetical protein